MIGSRLSARGSKTRLLVVLYGVLGLGGLGMAALFIGRGQEVPTGAGFMIVFGLGMSWLTWTKARKPLIVVRDEYIELAFRRRAEFIIYKKISTITRTNDGRLIVSVRDGHDVKNITIWLRELEPADADRLAAWLQNKEWKGVREGASTE